MQRADALWSRLAEAHVKRAWLFLLAAGLICVASLPLISKLGLDSRLIALLPDMSPSVRDLELVKDRMGGLSTLTVAVQSPSKDVEAMQGFTRALVTRLEGEPGESIGTIEWNINTYEEFVREHKHLYAPLETLEEIQITLDERIEEEKIKESPFYVDLEEDEDPDARLTELLDDLEKESDEKSSKYPGGFYQHPDRDLIVLFLRTSVSGREVQPYISRIRSLVDEVGPTKFGADLRVDFTGDLITADEEKQAIAQELVMATSITVSAVLILIMFFFRSVRSVFLLGTGLLPATLASFAIAALTVEELNTSTAFLGSIIIGNGVNPNIIWLARYFEERRSGKSIATSIFETHRNVWLATLVASGAAALAYGSLVITDFRGFKDFGVIGGVGMVLCWVFSFLFLPAATVLADRFKPLVNPMQEGVRAGNFADAFAKLTRKAPGSILAVSLALALLSSGYVYFAVVSDPLEYDFRKLRSERDSGHSLARQLNWRVSDIVDKSVKGDGIAILLPSVESAISIEKQLEKSKGKAHGKFRSLRDLLPKEVTIKKEILGEIRAQLVDLRPKVDEKTQGKIDEHMPPETFPEIRLPDIPAQVARPYSEKDGTRGTVIIVDQNFNYSTWDGRYLIRWAEALRALQLEDGSRPPLAGRAPVFADIIASVYRDMPKAISAAFLATVVLVFFAFARMRDRFLTLGSLLLGILWMAGSMAALGMKLNFLNFVAFPITFGNGVDYSVNVLRRYRLERKAGVLDAAFLAVSRSGGAVVLCSLTTIIGYTSLYISANQAMNSFGLAMAISEVTCLFAAVLTLPALLVLVGRRKERAKNDSEEKDVS